MTLFMDQEWSTVGILCLPSLQSNMAFLGVLLCVCIQLMLPSLVTDEPVRVKETALVNREERHEEGWKGFRVENRTVSSSQKNKRKSNQVRELTSSIFTSSRPRPKKVVDLFLFTFALYSSHYFSVEAVTVNNGFCN